jgi:formamidopyrimidine-DNA glycosylase
MPEGPEVRRNAIMLGEALTGHPLRAVDARTREARAWLAAHRGDILGREIGPIRSHGKHLIGDIGGSHYFHVHLMMWGSWRVVAPDDPIALERDRRERARLEVPATVALLFSAPIFNIGEGDPYRQIPILATLGPDILPEKGEAFDRREFLRRLLAPENRARTIGAALLDQSIVAGIGNYLRAEILFECAIDPWKSVEALDAGELESLCVAVEELSARALRHAGRTITEDVQDRMRGEPALVYEPGREWGMRHYVFRRTNLPCVRCGTTVRQLRQVTRAADPDVEDDEEKTRIIYFCPGCQNVPAGRTVSKSKRRS